jgi:hypothetical protein
LSGECRTRAAEQAALWRTLDTWEAPPVSANFDRAFFQRICEEEQLSWWARLWRPLRPPPMQRALPLTAAACLLLIAGLIFERSETMRPARPARETVRVDQVERTLDDLDLLHQFGPSSESATHRM